MSFPSTNIPRLKRDAAHPIAIGKTVFVISLSSGVAFLDGLAIIKGLAPNDHSYHVRFLGDPRVRVRVVHPIYQRNPAGAVAWLNALREQSEARPDAFFPDNL